MFAAKNDNSWYRCHNVVRFLEFNKAPYLSYSRETKSILYRAFTQESKEHKVSFHPIRVSAVNNILNCPNYLRFSTYNEFS